MIPRHAAPFLAASLLASAAVAAPQLDQNIRESLQSRVDTGGLASVVVGLVEGGETSIHVFRKSSATLPDEHSVFEIGDVSKTFTALLLAQAAKTGSVRLEQPVATLLPGYSIPSYQGAPITLLDLATHASGLPRQPGNMPLERPLDPYSDYQLSGMRAFLAGHQLTRKPGAVYEYSHLGYGLLGSALAAQAKLPFPQLVRDRITGPLGMDSTGLALAPALRDRVMPGFMPSGQVSPNWTMDAMAGTSAISSTVPDMLRYLSAMMRAEKGSPYAMTVQPRRAVDAVGTQSGLAWKLATLRGARIAWHEGRTGGYGSFAGFTLDGRRGVVILTNTAAAMEEVGLNALVPGGKPERVLLRQSPAALAAYAGRYELTPGVIVTLRPSRGGGLIEHTTGQGKGLVFAIGEDRFGTVGSDKELVFQRDAAGTVHALILRHPELEDRIAKKLPNEQRASVSLPLRTLREYAGRFRVDGGIMAIFSVKDRQLHVQWGQERFTLTPAAEDEFFNTERGLELRFKRNPALKVYGLSAREDGQVISGFFVSER
ncbi:serine hydrolase [Pseudoduganella sp. GCM10020061]|uniref:serine hydrolase n=1 Tax=Pseudoduganella sp. GCM10020061 TaxID=3317345 RepID=UPI00363BF01B